MKKLYLIGLFFIAILMTACGKKGEDAVVSDLSKKINNMDKYQVTGKLSIANNDDTYSYDVVVSYEKDDKYRVSLVNKANNHEQIILKNDTGVYVVTPSLNKSFKFQSDWPHNNSQIYLLQSLLNDIKNDSNRVYVEKDKEYVFTTKVNYPNNVNLVKQKIWLNNDLTFKRVEILNENDIPQMIMEFSKTENKPVFKDKYFELSSIIDEIEVPDPNSEKETSVLDDVIYPLYVPVGTSLIDKETVAKADGERIILTFDGEKPFLLVEETSTASDEFQIIPTFGEPYFLIDTVGALTNNSITWSSNGVDYYIVSDVMSQLELVEIASSISTIPTMK